MTIYRALPETVYLKSKVVLPLFLGVPCIVTTCTLLASGIQVVDAKCILDSCSSQNERPCMAHLCGSVLMLAWSVPSVQFAAAMSAYQCLVVWS